MKPLPELEIIPPFSAENKEADIDRYGHLHTVTHYIAVINRIIDFNSIVTVRYRSKYYPDILKLKQKSVFMTGTPYSFQKEITLPLMCKCFQFVLYRDLLYTYTVCACIHYRYRIDSCRGVNLFSNHLIECWQRNILFIQGQEEDADQQCQHDADWTEQDMPQVGKSYCSGFRWYRRVGKIRIG